jgi:hypothetical protein
MRQFLVLPKEVSAAKPHYVAGPVPASDVNSFNLLRSVHFPKAVGNELGKCIDGGLGIWT